MIVEKSERKKKRRMNNVWEEERKKKEEISSAQRDEGWMMIKHAHDKYCMQQKRRGKKNQNDD